MGKKQKETNCYTVNGNCYTKKTSIFRLLCTEKYFENYFCWGKSKKPNCYAFSGNCKLHKMTFKRINKTIYLKKSYFSIKNCLSI